MGPPSYTARKQRIVYLLSTTVEAQVAGKQEFARQSREIIVLTVHDPEKVLVNLPSPLTASEELHFRTTDSPLPIRFTAGLHRQTWISGYTLFVDIHVENRSNRDVNKIEVSLEKATVIYSFPPAATKVGPAEALRVPDRCERSLVAKSVYKGANGIVPAHTEVISTRRLEVPTGLVSVDTGRFFGVRFFLNVKISCSFAKHLVVQLPVTIIHPNSVDVPPNSLAQVATAIEYKHRDHTSINGSPYRYTPGRAFAAARERSYNKAKAATISSREIRDLALRLDGSPRKIKHRRSHLGGGFRNTTARDNRDDHSTLRPRASLDSHGPSLQRSTSGLAFDQPDKENVQAGIPKTPVTIKSNRSPFARSVLRELNVRAIRNSALSELANVAANTRRK
ncbi:MAG: hypothetical protein HETSPECPRED_002685 [Heterodermia speciosa]|uniref:Arrestin C-terminal-like domain-containing protein n=1 Tax=Heterodermia speciosa TaxID=116794 RepID=A0A8H3J5H6_9LECA|nr:MAG: hypothetical protein HETSPECPRED_002685 [Heterodermia speciosa]